MDEIAEVAAALERERFAFARCWSQLDEVQRADSIEFLLREVERFAAGNLEGRAISRAEFDRNYFPRED